MKEIVFNEILKTIENESIRLFGEKCIQTIPPYFWEIPFKKNKRTGKISCSPTQLLIFRRIFFGNTFNHCLCSLYGYGLFNNALLLLFGL